jgi:hypothetical protein
LGEPPQIGHGKVRNLGHIGISIGAGLKIDLDEAYAGQRTRFHVIHSTGEGEETLEGIGDVRFDLLRRHPVIESGHQHDGNINGGKHIHRHLNHAGNPEHNYN